MKLDGRSVITFLETHNELGHKIGIEQVPNSVNTLLP